jgi:hypothetical protein
MGIIVDCRLAIGDCCRSMFRKGAGRRRSTREQEAGGDCVKTQEIHQQELVGFPFSSLLPGIGRLKPCSYASSLKTERVVRQHSSEYAG